MRARFTEYHQGLPAVAYVGRSSFELTGRGQKELDNEHVPDYFLLTRRDVVRWLCATSLRTNQPAPKDSKI
jgi:hypothetical protein